MTAPAQEAQDVLHAAEAKPPWRRIVFLAILVAAFLAVVYLSPLRQYLGKVQELSQSIRGLGFLAPLVLTGCIAVLVAVGFPRLAFCVLAGMALGFWWGLLWAQIGTLIGNYVLFLITRASSGDWVRRYLAKRSRLAGLIHNEGIPGVILARQLPVPGLVVNLTLGMLGIRHSHFLIGTAIGQLPQAIPCTLIGAGVVKASFGHSAGFIGLAAALAVLVWLLLKWLMERRAASAAASAESK